jgi:hypothetical protein
MVASPFQNAPRSQRLAWYLLLLRSPRPAVVAREVGVEAVCVVCSLSRLAVEARGFELLRRPLLHRLVAGVVHVAVGLPSCVLQHPWWCLEWAFRKSTATGSLEELLSDD